MNLNWIIIQNCTLKAGLFCSCWKVMGMGTFTSIQWWPCSQVLLITLFANGNFRVYYDKRTKWTNWWATSEYLSGYKKNVWKFNVKTHFYFRRDYSFLFFKCPFWPRLFKNSVSIYSTLSHNLPKKIEALIYTKLSSQFLLCFCMNKPPDQGPNFRVAYCHMSYVKLKKKFACICI